MILIALSARHLTAQGAHYDELHQAPASFEYLGRHSPIFDYASHGFPVLNTTYTGAIKSNIYGLYLRFVNPHFTLTSWRLFGIAFLALGLFAFYQVVGNSISTWSAVVFGMMLLTDASVVLLNRHDMGPVSLALCLRLLFIALWISVVFRGPSGWKYVLIGFVVGISIFEKLSSAVMVVPLLIFLLASRKYLRRSWLFSGLGLLAGILPLLLINAASFLHGFGFVSLTNVGDGVEKLPLKDYLTQILQFGQGDQARQWILGNMANPRLIRLEFATMLVLLAIALFTALRFRSSREMTLAWQLLCCYVAAASGVYLLPNVTFVHHWIISTPFHYAAIALAIGAISPAERHLSEYRVYRWILVACLAVLIAIRLPSMWRLEASMAATTAENWSPALTRLAELAASHASDSAFFATDWGTGTQIYCFGDGQEDLLYEPYWSTDPEKKTLDSVQATKKNNVYTLVTGFAPQFQQASASILHTMDGLPGWQEVPVEQAFKDVAPTIRVRKFTRRTEP